MTQQEINQVYNRIIGSLDSKELKNAFDSLQSLISGSREYTFQENLDEMQETYKNLLRYRMDGVKDPMQDQIYRSVRSSAYELADMLKNKLLTEVSTISFYSRRRSLQHMRGIRLENMHQLLQENYNDKQILCYEEVLSVFFNLIWTSDPFTPADSAAVREVLANGYLPHTVACQTMSALVLSLQTSFDKEKLFLLFDAVHASPVHASAGEEVRIRAIIGILLTLYVYRKRTSMYPGIADRLAILAEEPNFTRTLRAITLRFILARETEKITRKLHDEIIPEVMKLNPGINKKTRPGDFNPEAPQEDRNPEWHEILANSSLGKKVEEFNELQQEGADVMHSTFINLKSFPFFREMSNWFLPFTVGHSIFMDLPPGEESFETDIIGIMTMMPFMCNSDKYSFYLSIMQFPREMREAMSGQLFGQASEINEQSREKMSDPQRRTETLAGQYIQDLYRFFKLYPARTDFEDIFMWPLDFHNLTILQPYLSDQESLITIAEYYLRKNYFNDALTIYASLSKAQTENDMLLQKIGYCRQMEGDMDGALEAYLHADLLNTGSKWLIRRIAMCYRSLRQPSRALEYFRRYDELSPGNLSVQMSIGHCLLELRDYDEALKYYFKVDYLDTKSHRAWRPVAWCSFLTGRYDQARAYYNKIIHEDNPDMHDLLNAGHTEWAMQNDRKAIDFYLRATGKEDGGFYRFREQFVQDAPDLIAAGISEMEVPLMLDQLKYLISYG
ncbi:MAG: tetratricopeptide repeat protein [Tannerellaceae bacterium]|jgi:tetratricopeptide (TPR) repeat protein|nr:tetratricopeptide repeat protein [Tannerellaceae bacterium]